MPSLSHGPRRLGSLLTLPTALVAAALCGLAVVGVTSVVAIRNAYRDEVRAVLMNSERSAQKLAVRAHEVIDQVDQTTRLVKALHETRNPMGLGALRDASLDAGDVTRTILVSDRVGRVEDRTWDDVGLDIANADAFKHQSRELDRHLTLGPPARRSVGEGWVIPAMRRIEREGVFDGVVVAYIDPSAFTRGFDAGELPGTLVGVLGQDNIYRAMLLDGHFSVGEETDQRALLADARKAADTLEPSISMIDGKARFVTAVPVERYPLYAVVSASADQVMTGYRQTRRQILSVAAGIATLLSIGTALLWQQARRLDTSRKRARRAEALYRATSEGSLDALFMLEARRNAQGAIDDFVFTEANTRGLRLLRHARDQLIGTTLSERAPQLYESSHLTHYRSVVETRASFEVEYQTTGPDGLGEWLHQQVVPLEDGVAIISRDITDRKAAQEQLDRLARYDALTQLPNRRFFEEHLEQATARARRSGKPLTLVFLDLDGFKRVNDLYGHAVGDQLLIEVARRLKTCVRTTDHVSRLGGDEFTVILEESGSPQDRLAQTGRLLSSLSRPHALANTSVIATPSLGVAVYEPGEPLPELVGRADVAMYEAKRAGKACLRWAAPANMRVRETAS